VSMEHELDTGQCKVVLSTYIAEIHTCEIGCSAVRAHRSLEQVT
jgi:hypothetical protein